MNPLRLRASAFRSYPELDLSFPDGCVAIVGPNGSGKSSLIAALDVALFGGRNLADYLCDDGDSETMWVELTFEHAGETWRVRRTYSAKGRGKSTTDLELYGDGEWHPHTRETQAATQEAIEEVLGLNRRTLRASALLMQGDGAAFCDAPPAEAMKILIDTLGLSSWERFLEAVRADRRAADRSLAETDGRIALLSERGGDLAALGEAKLRAEEIVADRDKAMLRAGVELDLAAERVSAIERSESSYRTAQAAVETARARLAERQGVVDRAAQAKTEAVELQRQIDEKGDPSRMLTDLAEIRAGQEALRELRREGEAMRDRYLADAEGARRQVAALVADRERTGAEYDRLAAQAEHLALDDATEGARCPTCDQALQGEAHATALARIREQRDDAEARLVALANRTREQEGHEASWRAAAAQVEIPDAPTPEQIAVVDGEIERWRAAETALAVAQQRLRSLEATIAELTPEVMTELEALNVADSDAQAALAAIDEPEPGALEAARVAAVTRKAELDITARALTEARENLIRAESALEAAQTVAADLAEARAVREELTAEIEILTTLERAYGRDGIPSLIVEASAIPQIEAEANRILSELGTAYRVELRTQRELKSSDGLADTLDVVVIGEAGARAYETFSGGERSRLNVALRIALARLLAHRRGAESRVLVLDEVEYLDEAGQAALAGVLLELSRSEFDKVVTVSHATTLRDVFDNCITVEKVDGRSVIA